MSIALTTKKVIYRDIVRRENEARKRVKKAFEKLSGLGVRKSDEELEEAQKEK